MTTKTIKVAHFAPMRQKEIESMKAHFKAIFNSYSDIFFLKGFRIGVLLFAITLLHPNVAIAGILAVLSAYLFARFIEMDREFLKTGYYTYIPLLVGLSIGYLFEINTLTLFMIVTAGIFTFVLTTMLGHLFWHFLRLPILSLPFVLVSSIAYLASSQYSNLYVSGQYPRIVSGIELYVPYWLAGFLKSLGAILFMPEVLAGALFLLIILFTSRILFLLAVGGYYAGTLVNALLIGSFQQAFADVNSFNFILIAIALGGVFLIPSPRTYVIAIIGVFAGTFLLKSVEVFWSTHGIPAFTMPFNLVSLSLIYVLGIVQSPLLALNIRRTPEETLDDYLANVLRYPGSWRSLALPFSGKWRVWQAFDGKWTHQGSWRYAYDFVITDETGSTFKNDGASLDDYYAFRKPVLSPVRGRVVNVVHSQPDLPIGEVDKINNWGNWVIIHDPRGFYVEISHFVQDSIKVKQGDWVETGAFLGLCGNSGYSPQPHIHIQVQATEEIGSYTVPFSFTGFVCENRYFANHLPELDAIIEPAFLDKALDRKLSFILDQEFRFAVLKNGATSGELHLTVRMAPDGTFYFDSGDGQLYFGKNAGTFYFYRVDGNDERLNAFLVALPRLPLAFRAGMRWTDAVPVGAVVRGFRKATALFFGSFRHQLNQIEFNGTAVSENLIEGEIRAKMLNINGKTSVELDEFTGFKSVKMNGMELRKIENEITENSTAETQQTH